jgi:hypothetical protein
VVFVVVVVVFVRGVFCFGCFSGAVFMLNKLFATSQRGGEDSANENTPVGAGENESILTPAAKAKLAAFGKLAAGAVKKASDAVAADLEAGRQAAERIRDARAARKAGQAGVARAKCSSPSASRA